MPPLASRMVALGTPAPDFALPDVSAPGAPMVRRDEVAGAHGLLVMFICNHCPFVKLVADELAAIGRAYAGRGVGIVAISANDAANYPDDAPDRMAAEAKDRGFVFPYLHDETQDVARAYGAECTPDFFLFDRGGKLAYRGQLDDARPGNGVAPTGRDLRAALDAVIAGAAPAPDQTPAIGCSIKWKAPTDG